MKALILAAGEGKRLRPLTLTRPKPLLPLAGEPLIFHLVEALKGFEVGIVVNYMGERIKSELKKRFPGKKIEFILQKELKGTGHAVLCAEDWVGDDDFLVLMGDNFYERESLLRAWRQECCVCTFRVENPERFGVVIKKEGKLVRIEEKPKKARSDEINTGLYKLTPEIFEVLKKVRPSERGEIEITDAINLLAKERHVGVVELSFWLDIGTPYSYLRANMELMRRRGLEIQNNVIFEGARIGEGCELPYSIIGEADIGDGVKVLARENVTSYVNCEPVIVKGPFGAVIADGVRVEGGSIIEGGTVIYPGKRVSGYVRGLLR